MVPVNKIVFSEPKKPQKGNSKVFRRTENGSSSFPFVSHMHTHAYPLSTHPSSPLSTLLLLVSSVRTPKSSFDSRIKKHWSPS